jgi:sialic acid synthase SpsE
VSKLADIEAALELLRGTDVTLLHCVTAYPAPETDYNLRVLPLISRMFGVSVGVSDHADHPFLVGALGVSMGATVVEKHVTLSRDDPGLDDPIAQDETGFGACVAEIRRAEAEEPEDTRRRLVRDHGEDLIEAVLGSGVKRLAPAEAENYERTTRSLHALRELPVGHVLVKGDFAALRTEKVLRPGLHPKFADEVLGAALTRLVPAGEGIRWADLLNRPATDFPSTVST